MREPGQPPQTSVRSLDNMKKFFSPNIETAGRLMRGLGALGLFAAGYFAYRRSVVAGMLLAMAGLFVLFEALRGWCALRACGIKTKI